MAAKSRSATASAGRTRFAEDGSNGKLMNVGFIGLGHMGAGMAANLLKAGHRVTVFNRTPAKAEALIKQGATLATSIAEASRSDAVVTMLANDEAVENVVLGRDGVIANLPAGGLHVSSSTIRCDHRRGDRASLSKH
jgi:3-hydroxyisobutyrate dehydrogenase-like beta-hydroxyacid dehydrogenase